MAGMDKEKKKKYFDLKKNQFASNAGKGDTLRGSQAKISDGLERVFGAKCYRCKENSKDRVEGTDIYWCENCRMTFRAMP